MENEEFETTDSTNGENENADSTNSEEADVDTLKQQLADKEEQNKKLYKRMKDAEELAKKLKPETRVETKSEPKEDNFSLKDIRALQDVPDDDVDEVIKISKVYGITIPEAKKLTLTQTLLKTKAEERQTAQATNIGKGGKGTSKVTGESMLERAKETNSLPDDDEAIRQLSESFVASKKKS